MFCKNCGAKIVPRKHSISLECSECGFDVKDSAAKLGYVYIIKAGDYYKIGYSKSPKQRAKTIETATPFDVVIIHTIYTHDMPAAEERIHRQLKKYHIKREWYALDRKALDWLKSMDSILTDK